MTEESSEATRRTAAFWNERHQDAEAEAHDNFFSHPLVHAYISLRSFGVLTGHLEAARVAIEERTRPGDTILSVGCGGAVKERVLARGLPDRRFIGADIAEDVLDLARAAAEREGLANLELVRMDFNDLDLEPDSLNVILGLGAIHHVEALEDFWAQAARALRPGGAVLAQEYVGANRLQWTPAQREHGTRALRELVPTEHHVHHSEVVPIQVEELIAADPSEAVRSEEILDTCAASELELESVTGCGCALLQPVLMHQVATFDPRNWTHNLTLARLFEEEDRLMQAGELGHDFVMFVARAGG